MDGLRPLTVADVDACMALSAEANWNQEAADWRTILTEGEGRGIDRGGRLAASAAIVPYGGRFGWVCMVLVTAAEQRKGFATTLMRWGIERLESLGYVPGLDATPAGREVYLRLGFTDIYTLSRMERAGGAIAPPPLTVDVRPLHSSDLAALATFDTPVFGESREPLLASLAARRPDMAFAAGRGGAISGFALARGGRSATQIGPVVAQDEATAIALVHRALAAVGGPVFIDVADRHTQLVRWLDRCGFRLQRPFTRMLKGRAAPLDDPARVFAITGPEFG